MMISIQEFAEKNRLKYRLDGCGDRIVFGRCGHIGDGYKDGKLGVFVSLPTRRRWNFVRRKLLAPGFVIRQDADTEGVALFDPEDKKQVRLAQSVARIKTRRKPTPEQVAQLARMRSTPRSGAL